MRINMVFPDELLENLDKIAHNLKKSRSMLLRDAAKMLIEDYQKRFEDERRKIKIKKAISVQDSLRKKSGRWDGIAEVRKWREMKT
ncbi:ribbon-helix-helix protein, CopG family [bacterium]|nr:ribbon-helix-helix protein, CopG family [bacterium]